MQTHLYLHLLTLSRRVRASEAALKGFTLIELLVTVVIVGLLSAIAIPTYVSQIQRARTAEASAFIDGIIRGQYIYKVDNGSYATIGAVVLGDQFSRVESGDSVGIVAVPGDLSTAESVLPVDLDDITARWNFATRPTIVDPNEFKVAVEGVGGTPARLLGVYYDGTINKKFAIDFDNRF